MQYQMELQEAIKYVSHVGSFQVDGKSVFLEFGFAKRDNGMIGVFFSNVDGVMGKCHDYPLDTPAIITLKDYSGAINNLQYLQQLNEDLALILADKQVAVEPHNHNESL